MVDLDELQVEGARQLEATGELRDIQGYDDVYTRNLSTAYIGKEMVERFKGAAPADVLKGLLNVHSGDARNSGALDPNIRGIQGPGRVPVTIDGTEQALTVWRGYNGVNNRNYIDPNLIGGIQVFKGPNLERDVLTSVGGAVAVKTLDADDILREGQNFGMEVRVEGSNNAVAPRLPTLLTGRHGPDEMPGWSPYNDRTLYIRPRTSGDNTLLTVKDDYAYRIAAAGRLGNVSLMAAYAYRDKGNHFAGKHDSAFYQRPPVEYNYDHIRRLALAYLPGDEVPNSSSELESWLFKATWKPTVTQQLQFGYRSTLNHYGEIMPSRLNWANAQKYGAPHWPLSRVDMTAYNLGYRWKPANPWLDVHANVWRTDTVSDTYTAGGYPNEYSSDDPVIRNTAQGNAMHDRNGMTISNRMRLAGTLNLTVGGNFQHEKLRSKDRYNDPNTKSGFRMLPRAGRREEYDLHFNFDWQPTARLTLTAGARYSSFWSMDDLMADLIADGYNLTANKIKGRTAVYYTQEVYSEETYKKFYPNLSEEFIRRVFGATIDRRRGEIFGIPIPNPVDWYADANGRLHRADNPCTNGMLDGIENHYIHKVPNAITPFCHLAGTGGVPRQGSNRYEITRGLLEIIKYTHVNKRRGHGWVPAATAVWQLNDHARVYLRHTQAIRYPSMFESTIAFSSSLSGWGIQPERVFNHEISYVHDFSHLISAKGYANIKITYFHHLTKGAIDRDPNFVFWNVDRQTIRGVEFQGRIDNGRFFADLGLVRNLENEVCDEHLAVLTDPAHGLIPDCVKGGHVGGYLLSMSIPDFSANVLIGGRFFNQRMEVGARVTYHKKYSNVDFEEYIKRASPNEEIVTITNRLSLYRNTPLEWGDIILIDMYLNWRFSERFAAELTGTNLGDIYHIDPITRSAFPAPGRTLKFALTYRF